MTVFESDRPNTKSSARDTFDPLQFHSQSEKRTPPTEPIFAAGWILAGAHLECVASSLKFTLRATDRFARAQLKLLGQGRLSDPQEFQVQLRTVVDEARGCLGDIAEMASQEVRQLQHRLSVLQEATRGLAPEARISEGSYRRRWKAKL
jgi:hypothetical protein